ncbi:hypothetical protein [Phycisphaera mikurensis]|uniref:Uncharacterized protein n=1 Tax=Phycisphaera mikurensis (strain NBRC 102666 / KCTC 22515 / FYK2301M01) TaxID=1142394 RepID=I0IAX0_PHYMF|nr:hypothetical protein [Phycisphaera mikurensis]MBB6442618.1 hypothetical protein [Phycisphaera mikurensis]BAM02408.1 hypothetical protein PSMK_02490 [Phycisphaera mikurensis NBRC 102666]
MILHLLGPGSQAVHAAEAADCVAAAASEPAAVPLPAALAGDPEPAQHHAMTLGSAAAAAARAAGLATRHACRPPGGPGVGGRIPLACRAALRRALREAAAGARSVIAWDAASLAAAAAFLPTVPRVLRLSDVPPPDTLAWLVSRMEAAGFDVAAASQSLASLLVAGGLPAGRVRHHPARLDARRADAAATGHAGDGLALSVAGGAGVDARPLVLAAALAQEAGGRRVTLRLSPAADRLAEALDVAAAAETSAGGGPRVVQDPRMERPWLAFGAGETLLLPVGGPAHAARWAALAGGSRVFAQPAADAGLDPAETGRDGDYVARHPLPRDLAAAMVRAGAPAGERGSETETSRA